MQENKAFSAQGIRGVLIPVGQRYLLLPNAAVAEFISFKEPKPNARVPDWVLGNIDWRGLTVSVIAWERLVEGQIPNLQEQRIRIAILNTINGNPALSHIGLLSVGITRLTRIRADILAEDKTVNPTSPLIQAAVTITGLPAWIPNLDELEKHVLAAIQ